MRKIIYLMLKFILLFSLVLISYFPHKEPEVSYDYYTKKEVVSYINSKLDTCVENNDGYKGYSIYQIHVNNHNQLIVNFTHRGTSSCDFEYRIYMRHIRRAEIMKDKAGMHCIRLVCKYRLCNIMRKENIEGRHIYAYRQYTLPITFRSNSQMELKDAFSYLFRISKLQRKVLKF
jgi:hypothetical protein